MALERDWEMAKYSVLEVHGCKFRLIGSAWAKLARREPGVSKRRAGGAARRSCLVGEHPGPAGPGEDDLALGQVQLLGILAGDLGEQPLAVLEYQVDPDLEAEVDQALDHGLGGGAVRLQPQLDVVGADEQLAQPGDGADEAHHEGVGRV